MNGNKVATNPKIIKTMNSIPSLILFLKIKVMNVANINPTIALVDNNKPPPIANKMNVSRFDLLIVLSRMNK